MPGKNEIKVAGGGYKNEWIDLFSTMLRPTKHSWKIDYAYAYSVDLKDNMIMADVGIVELAKHKQFFDKRLLALPSSLKVAKIIPLCLGKAKLDLAKKDITGVGWGLIYEEAPNTNKPKPRNPIYSSCMTSQASPHQWRFQNCDMRRMRNRQTGLYECDRNNDPPDYTPGQAKRCQDFFQNTMHGYIDHLSGKSLKDTLEEVDMYEYSDDIEKSKKNEIIVIQRYVRNYCYNPNLLKKHGWCYLIDFPKDLSNPRKEAWGICSPACDPEIIKVSFDIRIEFHVIFFISDN